MMEILKQAAEIGPIIGQIGLTGGSMLAVWWINEMRKTERDERLRLQKERDNLLERVLKGLTDSTGGMSSTRDVINMLTGVLNGMRDAMLFSGRAPFPGNTAAPPSVPPAGREGAGS